MDGRIEVLGDKWFMPKFVEFQYGNELNEDNRVHRSVIEMLKKEGAYKGLVRAIQGCKDKDKDKDKDNKGGMGGFDFDAIWTKYPRKVGRRAAERHFRASVKTEDDFKNIHLALENYLQSDRVKKDDGKYIQNGSTWFNDWQGWLESNKDPLAKWRA
jgi:hypothetical protein